MSDLRLIARQIKARVSITEAASWYGYGYHEHSRNECPKCSSSSTSKKTLAIYDDASWYCFHCAEGGDVIDWLAAQGRTTKGEAIHKLAVRLGISGNISELIQYLKERMTPEIRKDLAREAENIRHARTIRQHFYEFKRKSTLMDDADYIRTVQLFVDLEIRAKNGESPQTAIGLAKFLVEGDLKDHKPGDDFAKRDHFYRFTNALTGYYAAKIPQAAIDRFGAKACDAYMVGGAPINHEIPKKHLEMADQLGLLGKKSKRPLTRGRMIFPIRDLLGRTIAYGARRLDEEDGPKYINSAESILYSKGSTLYGLFEAAPFILKRGYAVIVEGYGDTISLARHGIRNAVAPLGTSLTEDQADLLGRFTGRVVTLMDGDRAGRKAAKRADLTLRVSRLRPGHVSLEEEEDPEEAIDRLGPAKLLRGILEALPGTTPDPIDPFGVGNFRRKIGRE